MACEPGCSWLPISQRMRASGPPSGVLGARGVRGLEQELDSMPLGMGWRRHGLERASWEQSVDPEARKPRMSEHLPGLAEGTHERKPGVQPRGDELERASSSVPVGLPSLVTDVREQRPLPFSSAVPQISCSVVEPWAQRWWRTDLTGLSAGRHACPAEQPGGGGLLWSRPLTQRAPCSPARLLACASVCPSPPSASSAIL